MVPNVNANAYVKLSVTTSTTTSTTSTTTRSSSSTSDTASATCSAAAESAVCPAADGSVRQAADNTYWNIGCGVSNFGNSGSALTSSNLYTPDLVGACLATCVRWNADPANSARLCRSGFVSTNLLTCTLYGGGTFSGLNSYATARNSFVITTDPLQIALAVGCSNPVSSSTYTTSTTTTSTTSTTRTTTTSTTVRLPCRGRIAFC